MIGIVGITVGIAVVNAVVRLVVEWSLSSCPASSRLAHSASPAVLLQRSDQELQLGVTELRRISVEAVS